MNNERYNYEGYSNVFDAALSMDQTIKTLEYAIVVLQKENEELFEQLAEHSSEVKFPEPIIILDIDTDCKVDVSDNDGIEIVTLLGENLNGGVYSYPIEPGDRLHISRDMEYERQRLGDEIRSLHQEVKEKNGSTLEELSGSKLEEEVFFSNDPLAEKLWPPKQNLEEKHPLYAIEASSFNPDYFTSKSRLDSETALEHIRADHSKSEDIHEPSYVKGWTFTKLPENLDASQIGLNSLGIHEPSYTKGWDDSENNRQLHHTFEEFPVTPMQFATMIDTLEEMNRLIDEEESVARYLMLFEAFVRAQRGVDIDENIF